MIKIDLVHIILFGTLIVAFVKISNLSSRLRKLIQLTSSSTSVTSSKGMNVGMSSFSRLYQHKGYVVKIFQSGKVFKAIIYSNDMKTILRNAALEFATAVNALTSAKQYINDNLINKNGTNNTNK